MRAYHFLPAEFAVKDLEKGRLKISTYSDLNDPFELCLEISDKNYQEVFAKTKEDLYKTHGVICFSKDWSNPLLWSHYADKHKGICLGFDISDILLLTVKYLKNTNELCSKFENVVCNTSEEWEKRRVVLEELFSAKYVDWDYEEEIRIHVALKEKDQDMYFAEFDKDIALRQVIIGVRCDDATIKQIKKNVTEKYPGVEIMKARLDCNKFRVF